MNIIYKIYNNIDNYVYIGSTNNFNRRKLQHFWDLKNNKHHCILLQVAYNRLKETLWDIAILEEVTDITRWKIEQKYIDHYKPNIYNTKTSVDKVSEGHL